jgi:hypothetical protein
MARREASASEGKQQQHLGFLKAHNNNTTTTTFRLLKANNKQQLTDSHL